MLFSTHIGSLPGLHKLHPYTRGLQPLPSILCPPVSVKSHLQLWRPFSTCSAGALNLNPIDIQWITDILSHAWSGTALGTYGSGLLTYHVFCNSHRIPNILRAPASTTLLSALIASAASTCSGKTLASYLYAVHAWHIIHGVQWNIKRGKMKAMLKAAMALAPALPKWAPWEPYTVNRIAILLENINHTQPLGAVAAACYTTAFWRVACVGEHTLPNLQSFKAAHHVKPSDVQHASNHMGFAATAIFISETKSNPGGEEIYWAIQCSSSHMCG